MCDSDSSSCDLFDTDMDDLVGGDPDTDDYLSELDEEEERD